MYVQLTKTLDILWADAMKPGWYSIADVIKKDKELEQISQTGPRVFT